MPGSSPSRSSPGRGHITGKRRITPAVDRRGPGPRGVPYRVDFHVSERLQGKEKTSNQMSRRLAAALEVTSGLLSAPHTEDGGAASFRKGPDGCIPRISVAGSSLWLLLHGWTTSERLLRSIIIEYTLLECFSECSHDIAIEQEPSRSHGVKLLNHRHPSLLSTYG